MLAVISFWLKFQVGSVPQKKSTRETNQVLPIAHGLHVEFISAASFIQKASDQTNRLIDLQNQYKGEDGGLFAITHCDLE